ncbi:hypothetical protein [Clostridium niameyense]|uniref:hypothetical protein n=1 Tax=Clostridium niameyense TaxID=1622073 RepID=UPI0013D42724|nr:hypothetical protein [Clostridium niameyense]
MQNVQNKETKHKNIIKKDVNNNLTLEGKEIDYNITNKEKMYHDKKNINKKKIIDKSKDIYIGEDSHKKNVIDKVENVHKEKSINKLKNIAKENSMDNRKCIDEEKTINKGENISREGVSKVENVDEEYVMDKKKRIDKEKTINKGENISREEVSKVENVDKEYVMGKKICIDKEKIINKEENIDKVKEVVKAKNIDKEDRVDKKNESIIINVPVIVKSLETQISLINDIKIKDGFIEIHNVENRVFVEEGTLVKLNYKNNSTVFIKGYVRSFIEYSILDSIDGDKILTYKKGLIAYKDFKITSNLKFDIDIFNKNDKYLPIVFDNNDFKHNNILYGRLEKFAVKCHLKYEHKDASYNLKRENIFYSLKESMVINLNISFLQNKYTEYKN